MKAFAGPAVSVVAALVWLALAWRTPTSTFHFAPLIVAAAWPVVARWADGERFGAAAAGRTAAAAAGLALASGLVLLAADRLRGPTFWSESGQADQVMIEIVLATAIGAAYGFRVLTRERSGLLA